MYRPHFTMKENRVPVLSNDDIERDAMIFVNEFDPDMLQYPHALDIDSFLEFYLDLNLDFVRMNKDGNILGQMIFKDTKNFPIHNSQTGETELIDVRRGTVLLDEKMSDPENDTLRRTTEAHECGHWIYHQMYFGGESGRDVYAKACRKVDVVSTENSSRRLSTDEEWLEHHARLFSGAILMPRTAVFSVVKDKELRDLAWDDVRRYGFPSIGNGRLSKEIAEIFSVSEKAALVRLTQLKCDLASEAKVRGEKWMLDLIEKGNSFEEKSCF